MEISEKQALESLVTLGVLKPEIAEIVQSLAQDKAVDVEALEGTSVRPLVLLLDKSGSMVPLKQAMIDGQHHLINSLLGASSALNVYFGQILFNHEIQYFQDMTPFRDPVNNRQLHPKICLLDDYNYIPDGGTALYDTIVHAIAMLSPLLLGAEELGQQVMAHIAVITDGKDEHSKTQSETLKKVIDFVMNTGIIHRISLIGLGDYDYRLIGNSIGIEDIIEGSASDKEIRKTMDLISSHVIRDA